MNIDDVKFYKILNQITRSIEHNKKIIKEYESKKDSLSNHGYWSLGYYTGINSKLEDIFDDLKLLLNREED